MQGRKEFEILRHRDPATGIIPEGMRQRELAFARSLHPRTSKDGETIQDNGEWTNRGPWNIGGRSRTIAFDVKDPSTLLIGAVSGGLWRSTNAGSTWTLQTKPEDLHTVVSIAQDTRSVNGQTWYYTTGEIWGNSAGISGNGVYKSTDGGLTWEVLPSTVSPRTVADGPFAYTWRIVAKPNVDSSDLYVATSRYGVQRSTDGGRSWSSVIGSNAIFSDVHVTPNGVIYAALSAFTGQTGAVSTRWGVFRSVDGVTWQNVTPSSMNNETRRIVLAAVPNHPEQIWALAETPGRGMQGTTTYRGQLQYEWHSLWKYTRVTADSGRWDDHSQNLPEREESRGDLYSQGGYDLLVRVSPHDSNLVMVGGTNLYRSTDGFRSPAHTWIGGYWKYTPKWDRYSSYGDHHPDQHDVLFHPTDPAVMYSVNDGGVQRTDDIRADSVVWVDLNRGYVTTQHYTVELDQRAGSAKIIGGMQDNSCWATDSLSGTAFWRRLGGGDGAYCVFADSTRTEYYSSQQTRIYRIRRAADGTEIDRSRIDPATREFLFINPYTLHPRDEHIMYLAGGAVVMRNNDLRDIPAGVNDSTFVNWDTLRATSVAPSLVSAVCAIPTDVGEPHVLYYGTSTGRVYKLIGAESGQPVPTEVTGPTMPRGAFVNSITVNEADPEHLVVCFSNYGVNSVWETFNGGTSWASISGNLEENVSGSGNGPAVNWVGILPTGGLPRLYVAATSTGLYFTPQTNGMSTVWTPTATEVLGNVPCDMIDVRPADGVIAVATHGRGILTGRITSLPPSPSPPTLISPAGAARGIWPDTTLEWRKETGAGSYLVRLWKASAPDSVRTFTVRADTGSMMLPQETVVAELEQGPVEYRWTVESYGGGGGSGPSAPFSFFTAVRPPQLLSPAAGATDITQAVLTWERVPGATSYGIEVAPNAAFNPIISAVSGFADTTILVRGLENNKRYFWRVRSADADTVGVFSARRSFVTGVLTSVDDVQVRSGLRIEPNPAMRQTRVCVDDVPAGPWQLDVADAEGRILRTTRMDMCEELDLRDLAAGTYTVIIRMPSGTRSAPLVITR